MENIKVYVMCLDYTGSHAGSHHWWFKSPCGEGACDKMHNNWYCNILQGGPTSQQQGSKSTSNHTKAKWRGSPDPSYRVRTGWVVGSGPQRGNGAPTQKEIQASNEVFALTHIQRINVRSTCQGTWLRSLIMAQI